MSTEGASRETEQWTTHLKTPASRAHGMYTNIIAASKICVLTLQTEIIYQ